MGAKQITPGLKNTGDICKGSNELGLKVLEDIAILKYLYNAVMDECDLSKD